MSPTYALKVNVWSYDYEDTFYFVGDGYDTIKDVLSEVAADHIIALTRPQTDVKEYWLDAVRNGETDGEDAYQQADPDITCSVFIDIYYFRASLTYNGTTVELGRQPSRETIEQAAADFLSGALDDQPHLERGESSLDFEQNDDSA